MVRYYFTKIFTKGNLAGLSVHESMSFVNHDSADRWLTVINAARTLNFTIRDFYPEQPKIANY